MKNPLVLKRYLRDAIRSLLAFFVLCVINTAAIASNQAAPANQAETQPDSIVFFQSPNTSIVLTGVQSLSPDQWEGKLDFRLNKVKFSQTPRATFVGKLQKRKTTETSAYATEGNLTLIDVLNLSKSFAEYAQLSFRKGVILEKKKDEALGESIAIRGSAGEGLEFIFGDGAIKAGSYELDATELTINESGINGKMTMSPLSANKEFDTGVGFKVSLSKLTITAQNNRLYKLEANGRLRKYTASSPTEAAQESDVTFGLYPGSYDGNVLQIKATQNGDTAKQAFTLPINTAIVKVHSCVLDFSKTDETKIHPDSWTSADAEWQGVYIQKAELDLKVDTLDSFLNRFKLTTTDLYLDSDGVTGKLVWGVPEIRKGEFRFSLEPGELIVEQSKVTSANLRGKLIVEADVRNVPTQSSKQPVVVNWSVDLLKNEPTFMVRTPVGQEILLNDADSKSNIQLGITSGSYSNQALKLNGFLTVSNLPLFKGVRFKVENFTINTDGQADIGTVTVTDVNNNPVVLDAGPCNVSVKDLKLMEEGDTLKISLEGNISLKSDLALNITPVSVMGNGTASIKLAFKDKDMELEWEDKGINIEASNMMDAMHVSGKLHIRNIRTDEPCLFGNVNVKFDKLVQKVGENVAATGKSETDTGFYFLLTRAGWCLGGKYESMGKPDESGIPIGNTGLRVYKLEGAAGKNISFDYLKMNDALATSKTGELLSIVQATSSDAPALFADVTVGTSDGKTCWGHGKLALLSDRKIQIQGQFHLMQTPTGNELTPFLERINSMDRSSPTDPNTAFVNIVWDDVNKGLLLDLDSSLIMRWGAAAGRQMELKSAGKTQIFLSSNEKSLRLGSVDSLDENGVIVRTSDGSVFKSAFYVRMSPDWKINQIEMGVLWNKDFPLYDGQVNLNADVQGALYYFSSPIGMRREWKEALYKATYDKNRLPIVTSERLDELARQMSDEQINAVLQDKIQEVFVGKVAGRMSANVFIFNAQARGQALAVLTDDNLLLDSSASVSAGVLGINFPLLSTKKSIRFGGVKPKKSEPRDVSINRVLASSPRIDNAKSTNWFPPTSSALSVSLTPLH